MQKSKIIIYLAIAGIYSVITTNAQADKFCSGSLLLETAHSRQETLQILENQIIPKLSQCNKNIIQVSQNDHTEQVARNSENIDQDIVVIGLAFQMRYNKEDEKYIKSETFDNDLRLGQYSQESIVDCFNQIGKAYHIIARPFSNATCHR
jgi:hypothetical protein